MGRYAVPLASQFAALAQLDPGQRVLDVGCGTGALTAELVGRLSADRVSAVDPSEAFVASMREQFPEVDVRRATAEDLPFSDGSFDTTLAQLVVHFMSDPVAGLTEMARVTRPGGVVSACVWDQASGTGPLAVFWRAVRDVDPAASDESELPGVREGHLIELFHQAGLVAVEPTVLTVTVRFASFEEWWEPFTLGVGPAGAYVARLDARQREVLAAQCSALLPQSGPFDITASAWAATARVR
jgi:SAM-dependent methyltransferase